MLRNLLWWAITHDQRERVALLAANGVDVTTAFTELRMRSANGATPLETALTSGHSELADQLVQLGATRETLDPVAAFVAAALAGDGHAVRRTDPATVAAARKQRPGLVTWAATQGAPNAVDLLVAAGFDVNAFGRSDAPIDEPWESALHVAAQRGNGGLAQRLLDLGADPDLRDRRFEGTALDWARHFEQPDLVAMLVAVRDAPTGGPGALGELER
jgi:ankyrin repeat protein